MTNRVSRRKFIETASAAIALGPVCDGKEAIYSGILAGQSFDELQPIRETPFRRP